MGSRVRVPYAPQKLSRNSFELRESFCFWAEELSGQSESFPERVAAVVDGATPQKEAPLHGLRVRGLILLRFAKR